MNEPINYTVSEPPHYGYTCQCGVTINGTPGLKLRDQYSSCTLIKRSAANLNVWIVIGDLSA